MFKLSFTDSSCLRVLITTYHRAERQRCTYTLRSRRRAVLNLLRLTGFDRLLTIEQAPDST